MDQLEKALEVQVEHPDRTPVEILTEIGGMTEERVVSAIADATGIPFIDFESFEVSADVASLFPSEVLIAGRVVPVRMQDDVAVLAGSNPFDPVLVNHIRDHLKMDVEVVLTTSTGADKVLHNLYGSIADQGSGSGEAADAESVSSSSDSPAVKFVDRIISDSVRKGCTDIHIEPNETYAVVRYRIDGVLFEQMRMPISTIPSIVSRIKVLSEMDIAERRLPQAGRMEAHIDGQSYDMRVSTFPMIYGENVVIRVLAKNSSLLSLEHLGFGAKEVGEFEGLIHRPNGIILVTGPTGSGKSTTLYAALNTINGEKISIHTLEDPVEYRLDRIRQTQINPKADMSFARGLRDLLRQDPDVIMIGEIRDVDTAEVAIHASLTGHLVMSTLHTNSAAGAFQRLDNMEIEPFLIASSVIGVIGQRLARRVCEHCRVPDADLMTTVLEKYVWDVPEEAVVYKAVGCGECRDSGYSGRLAIHEVMLPDDDVQRLIIQKKSAAEIETLAVEKGMVTLFQDGLRQILLGRTTLEEVLRVTSDT